MEPGTASAPLASSSAVANQDKPVDLEEQIPSLPILRRLRRNLRRYVLGNVGLGAFADATQDACI